MMELLKYLNARLGEPSTWAGISALLLGLHVNIDPGLLKQVTLYAPIVTGVLSILLSDVGNKAPAPKIAEDLIEALATAIATKTAAPTTPTAPGA